MRKTNDWMALPGTNGSGFISAHLAGKGRNVVPVIFHEDETLDLQSIVRRADPSVSLEETTHISARVTLMWRFMDPREYIDPITGYPVDKKVREEWEAMCEAMAGGELGEDPRIMPCIDLVRAHGKLAVARDPVTGAKSNRLSLSTVGDVNIQIPYRNWYPSYNERISRVVKNSAMSLDVLAGYMLAPLETEYGFLA